MTENNDHSATTMNRRAALKQIGLGALGGSLLGGFATHQLMKDAKPETDAPLKQQWLYIGPVVMDADGRVEHGHYTLNWPSRNTPPTIQPCTLEDNQSHYTTVVLGLPLRSGPINIPPACTRLFIPQAAMNGVNSGMLSVNGGMKRIDDKEVVQAANVYLLLPGLDGQGKSRVLNVAFPEAADHPLPDVFLYNDKHQIVAGVAGKALAEQVQCARPAHADTPLLDHARVDITPLLVAPYRAARNAGTIGIVQNVGGQPLPNTARALNAMAEGLGNKQIIKMALEQTVVVPEKQGLTRR